VSVKPMSMRDAVAYKLVNVNQNARFGVFGRQEVTVDCDTPSLVSTQFGVAIQAVNNGSELGPKQEDVDTAVG